MYQHILVPIDCTDASRNLVPLLAHFVAPLIPCRVTLAVTLTPTPTQNSELHDKRRRHASDALHSVQQLLLQEGIWSGCCLVEGSDPAAALAAEARNPAELYDLIVLGTHQTRPEDLEAPCRGSFADQICACTSLPVLILPQRGKGAGAGPFAVTDSR